MADLGNMNMTVKIDVDTHEAEQKLLHLSNSITSLQLKGMVQQEVERQLALSPQVRLKLIGNIALMLLNIISFVGIFYFFFAGYPHILAGNATNAQPTLGFLCIVVFLFVFFTAVQLTPTKQKERR